MTSFNNEDKYFIDASMEDLVGWIDDISSSAVAVCSYCADGAEAFAKVADAHMTRCWCFVYLYIYQYIYRLVCVF